MYTKINGFTTKREIKIIPFTNYNYYVIRIWAVLDAILKNIFTSKNNEIKKKLVFSKLF